MKLKNKISSVLLVLVVSLSMVACDTADNNIEEVSNQNEIQNSENISLDNLETYEDINLAYEQNINKIMNKEQLRELDMMNITKDNVLNYAKKASELCSSIEGFTDKIDTVNKLVSLNDLSNNTTQETMEDTIKYIISEYENNKLQDGDKVLEYQYILRYLDKRLDNHPNMKIIDDLVLDMYQICNDYLRDDNSRIDANIDQINSNIPIVKSMLE